MPKKLKGLDYYILQNQDQDWSLTTLAHRDRPKLKKKVIYAFLKAKYATNFQKNSEQQRLVVSIPVTHLLFQLFALKQVDSIIFMETLNHLNTGQEIKRIDLQTAVQKQIKTLKQSPPFSSRIPSNFA